MNVALEVGFVVAGALVIVGTVGSAIRTTILPRSAPVRLTRFAILSVGLLFHARLGRSPSYERTDTVMALFAPVMLLVMLGTWMVAILGGFWLIDFGIGHVSGAKAFQLSGSSIFTLGTTPPDGVVESVIAYCEAGLGLLLLTLLITYLPSMYAAFSRRERGVSLLRVRAGTPPRATTLLIRYHRIDEVQMRLSTLWQDWQKWFAEVEEGHTTFQALAFFRSPVPDQSWIVAAGVLLDAASFWVGCLDHTRDPDAQLCIRAGFQALRRIADVFGLPYDPDPAPDDPIAVSRQEWDEAMDEMEAEGLPIISDRDAAWQAWAGWRVNYDSVLLGLSKLVLAPTAPWVSDRPALTPQRSLISVLRGAPAHKTNGGTSRLRRGLPGR